MVRATIEVAAVAGHVRGNCPPQPLLLLISEVSTRHQHQQRTADEASSDLSASRSQRSPLGAEDAGTGSMSEKFGSALSFHARGRPRFGVYTRRRVTPGSARGIGRRQAQAQGFGTTVARRSRYA